MEVVKTLNAAFPFIASVCVWGWLSLKCAMWLHLKCVICLVRPRY